MIGCKFGRLTVLSESTRNANGKRTWVCLCDCGKTVTKVKDGIVKGDNPSCGCSAYLSRTKHGMTNTRTYKTWEMMIQRCTNENFDSYPYYGGRGIKVCNEWLDFKNFYSDMGERPANKSLDRIDVNLGYSKDNCIWSDQTTQLFNRRTLDSNRSGHTGVYIHKSSGKWTSQIVKSGVNHHLGLFASFADAVKARQDAEIKYYGRLK